MSDPVNQNSCDLEDSPSGSNEGQPARKIRKTKKNFQETWFEEFPSWREWVVTLSGKTHFHCKVCNKILLCGKSEIQKHEASLSHKNKKRLSDKLQKYGIVYEHSCNSTADSFSVDSLSGSSSSTNFSESKNSEILPFKQKVQEAENRITAFFVEHNLPFAIGSELVGLFRDIEPSVLKDVKLSRTKMTMLAKNVVCDIKTELQHDKKETASKPLKPSKAST